MHKENKAIYNSDLLKQLPEDVYGFFSSHIFQHYLFVFNFTK